MDEVVDKQYTEGVWSLLPRHACKLCPFDTMEGHRAILMHLVEVHGSSEALEELFPTPSTPPAETAEPVVETTEPAAENPILETDPKEVSNDDTNPAE